MIIILDLDKTLVFTPDDTDSPLPNLSYFKYLTLFIHKRPNLDKFITNLVNDNHYDFVVWSAGIHPYVHCIVDNIFPKTSPPAIVMSREDCNEYDDKPLSKVRSIYNNLYCGYKAIDKKTKQIITDDTDEDIEVIYSPPKEVHDFIIIDDRDNITYFDQLNHLQIHPFEGDKNDKELDRLWKYLSENKGKPSEWLCANW